MKKIFCCVPMNGRKVEDIEKSYVTMKTITEKLLGEEVEVIQSWNPLLFQREVNPVINGEDPFNPWNHRPTMNPRVYALGRSIELLAHADLFVYCSNMSWTNHPGCDVEWMVAERYDIKKLCLGDVTYILPDVKGIE